MSIFDACTSSHCAYSQLPGDVSSNIQQARLLIKKFKENTHTRTHSNSNSKNNKKQN